MATASAAQAADIIVLREKAPAVITAPSFSWTDFYLGGQVGNFSSQNDVFDLETKEKTSDKDGLPKP